MSIFYNSQRLKEQKLQLEDDYAPIAFSSVSGLYDFTNLNESLAGKFSNEFWSKITSNMFKLAILNLLFSEKISAFYFFDKKSVFFNQFVYKHEGFNIYIEDNISY